MTTATPEARQFLYDTVQNMRCQSLGATPQQNEERRQVLTNIYANAQVDPVYANDLGLPLPEGGAESSAE